MALGAMALGGAGARAAGAALPRAALKKARCAAMASGLRARLGPRGVVAGATGVIGGMGWIMVNQP